MKSTVREADTIVNSDDVSNSDDTAVSTVDDRQADPDFRAQVTINPLIELRQEFRVYSIHLVAIQILHFVRLLMLWTDSLERDD